jgi:hypothetical protein
MPCTSDEHLGGRFPGGGLPEAVSAAASVRREDTEESRARRRESAQVTPGAMRSTRIAQYCMARPARWRVERVEPEGTFIAKSLRDSSGMPQREAAQLGTPKTLAMDATEEVLPPFKDLFNMTNDIVHPLRASTSLVLDITTPVTPEFGLLSK